MHLEHQTCPVRSRDDRRRQDIQWIRGRGDDDPGTRPPHDPRPVRQESADETEHVQRTTHAVAVIAGCPEPDVANTLDLLLSDRPAHFAGRTVRTCETEAAAMVVGCPSRTNSRAR